MSTSFTKHNNPDWDAMQFIARKRDGFEHGEHDIQRFIRGLVDGDIPDYQTSAWLMAAYLNGLSAAEAQFLTSAMRNSGRTLSADILPAPRCDKHSTGGVGDKTSLVVAPILAAAGVSVLKMSGHGLGHTGGTLDKLEAIPGFRCDLPVEEAINQVKRIGLAIIGQTVELVPADKKLYALRDVTATVDSIPLIAASIMSKKLAAGSPALVLDVKVGAGAFMKTVPRARELAHTMLTIAENAGVAASALLTDMNQPLGATVGNALEIIEAVGILTGSLGKLDLEASASAAARFRTLCLEMAAAGLVLTGKVKSHKGGYDLASRLLEDGSAAAKLEAMVAAQYGEAAVVKDPLKLELAPVQRQIKAERDGYLISMDAQRIGEAAADLGGGRHRAEDAVDHAVGVVIHRSVGEGVKRGEPILTVYSRDEDAAVLKEVVQIGDAPPASTPIVLERLP